MRNCGAAKRRGRSRWNVWSRRTLLLLPLSAFALMFSLAGCNQGDIDPATVSPLKVAVPADFVGHRDSQGRVTIKTPASWHEGPAPGPQVALFVAADRPGAGVSIVRAGPAEKVKRVMKQIAEDDSKRLPGFKKLKTDTVQVAGLPAGRIEFEGRGPGGMIRLMQVVVAKDGYNYILTFSSPVQSYAELYPTAEQVVASMTIP